MDYPSMSTLIDAMGEEIKTLRVEIKTGMELIAKALILVANSQRNVGELHSIEDIQDK